MRLKDEQTEYKPDLPEITDKYFEGDPRLLGEPEKKLQKKIYEAELFRLQVELVKMLESLRANGHKLIIVFEGRDAAGKGGVIRAIRKHLNPRQCRVAALPSPSEREKTQWYFQRYVAHFPAAGEIVLFDRSWYNRAGVERVMGFCTEEQYQQFLEDCPTFEKQVIDSGTQMIKFWFSVSKKEQEKRFQKRRLERHKHWKLSPMDLESRARWQDYSKAKDEMFQHTDTDFSPWIVVPSDDKKRARLNTIAHILDSVPYEDLHPEIPELVPLNNDGSYKRAHITSQKFIAKRY